MKKLLFVLLISLMAIQLNAQNKPTIISPGTIPGLTLIEHDVTLRL